VAPTPRPSDESTQGGETPDGYTPRRSEPPLGRGDTLGRYVVLERLGVGGMGEVFAAYDPELDRKIAVKLLRHDASGSAMASERLQREAQAMAKLSHRNVITVHDVGTHAGRVFVAMEFVDGGTLADWLRAGPHPWPDVLERFLAAGEGLAAAHAEGLVHRDFKPANVLLGSDGRVRVADFGIARRTRDTTEPPVPVRSTPFGPREPRLAPVPASEPTDVDDLTRTGTMLGTPAYMAPEQYARVPVDARADQFSFCVALYEALYGERPFEGDSLHAVMYAVHEGRVREPPIGSAVPNWVRRAVIGGLAADPDRRWSDMDMLLSQLRTDPERVRRRRARRRRMSLGMLGLAGALSWIGWIQTRREPLPIDQQPSVCVGAEQAFGSAWDSSDRAAVTRRFDELGATTTELLPRLDAWARDWQRVWVDACQATRVRGDQSEDLLDRRMACLDRRRSSFAAFVDTLAEADSAVASRAVDLLGELGGLDTCSDRAALMQQVPLPDDPERVALILEGESQLEQVRLMQLAGSPRAAGELLEKQGTLVEKADWGPLTAVFLSAQAWQAIDLDRPAEGERLLKRAFATAIAAGDDSLARALARRIAATWKNEPERAHESLEWLELATALAIRESAEDPVLAQLALVRSETLATLGKLDEAQDAAHEAYDRLARSDPDGMAIGRALYVLARGQFNRGRYAEASAYLDRSVAIWSREFGPDHNNQIAALGLRGAIGFERGEFGQAREAFEKVLAVRHAAYGPEGSDTLDAEFELARVLLEFDELEQTRSRIEHVVAGRRALLGPEHSSVGESLLVLADLEHRSGNAELAWQHVVEAERILAPESGPEHAALVAVLLLRGRLERERGEHDEARRSLLRAKTILEHRTSLSHPTWLRIAAELAETELAAGRPHEALRWLDEVGELELDDRRERARREFVRARAQAELGELDEARTLATAARESLARLGQPARRDLAAIDAWLSTR
jgi:tetratricopeptide (TPR) repeat protein/predicted Ser/Thr protein kinase